MIVSGWHNIEELVYWCNDKIGSLVWTNGMSDWIGTGWVISRVKDGFRLEINDEELLVMAALRWG